MNPIAASAPTDPILDILGQIHQDLSGVDEGRVATYIPELAKADPAWFGICLVTATGAVYEVGDTGRTFTIQSISKPFVYGLALEDNGRAEVLKKVGVEPTGDVFNSISLEPGSGRPRNPMINAGAIATTGLIAGLSPQSRLKRILATFGTYAGRELSLDESVYRSEHESGHRNRAIGHMLRNFDILTSDPIPVVDLYFRQCSIAVTCRDLAMMAATLANRGVNPVTGRQAIRHEYIESVLSVMESCGTYDFAGEWIYNVGLPAKSGVAGGIIAVLPGQLGIGVFSPPLDERGNSVRGIRACRELSHQLDLHQLSRPATGRVAIRARLNAADFNSSRMRTPEESLTLRKQGRRIRIYQLQGHLSFSTTETVLRDLLSEPDAFSWLVLDFKRVLSVNECACRMLQLTLEKLAGSGKWTVLVQTSHLSFLRRYLKARLGERLGDRLRHEDEVDSALEWCEDRLLETGRPPAARVPDRGPANYELFAGLSQEEIAVVSRLLRRDRHEAGSSIIRAGDEAGELFFLASGQVGVLVTLPSGARKRLATFSPGMTFGEMAIIDRAPRSAQIVADTPVECDSLPLQAFDDLGRTHPGIKIRILENLCVGFCRKLRKANRELSLLE